MTKPTKWHVRPREDSDQHGHPPSLIMVFSVDMKKAWVLSYPLSAQQRLWSDWVQSFCWFCREVAHLYLICLIISISLRLQGMIIYTNRLDVKIYSVQ